MKKIILLLVITLFISGCSLFKRDSMENIDIITTNYALEFVSRYLYGENALITSIYPDGINIDNYTFTEKQIKDYSKKDLLIYMANTDDYYQAATFLNNNNKIKMIDATQGVPFEYKKDEFWLNPLNLISIAGNIKNGLGEYITSTYLLKDIEKLYSELNILLSSLDAEFKTTIENANYKTIVVNSDNLLFLQKYDTDFKVISLDKNNESYDKNLALFKSYYEKGTIKYLYIYEGIELDSEVSKYVEDKKIETINIKNLKNITDDERDNDENYLTIMYDNLEKFKKELYKSN